MSELDWLPYLPLAHEPRKRPEAIPGMTDDEILAFVRDRRGNPFLTLRTAKALYGLDLKCRTTVRAMAQAERDAAEAQRQHLRDVVNRNAHRSTPR